MNDVCLLFNQYDYACSCDYTFRAHKSPLELWAFVCSLTVHIYSHFSIKCYLFNRGSVIKLIIYVTWTFRMLYLFGEGSELKFICATYLRFEWNNKLQKHNGSHTNSYFWVCFFSPQIFFSLKSNCQFFSREFSMFKFIFFFISNANGSNGNLFELI